MVKWVEVIPCSTIYFRGQWHSTVKTNFSLVTKWLCTSEKIINLKVWGWMNCLKTLLGIEPRIKPISTTWNGSPPYIQVCCTHTSLLSIFVVMLTCRGYSIIVLLNEFYHNPSTLTYHKIPMNLILVFFNWW